MEFDGIKEYINANIYFVNVCSCVGSWAEFCSFGGKKYLIPSHSFLQVSDFGEICHIYIKCLQSSGASFAPNSAAKSESMENHYRTSKYALEISKFR